jgi:hypothetical protein
MAITVGCKVLLGKGFAFNALMLRHLFDYTILLIGFRNCLSKRLVGYG